MQNLIIFGTGGNALEICEAARASGKFTVLGFLDDAPDAKGRVVLGAPVLGTLKQASQFKDSFFINGIGTTNNFWKKESILRTTGVTRDRWANVIHPQAWVSPTAHLGKGIAVLAHASISPESCLGDDVLLLPQTVVSHHSQVGAHSCLATGAIVSGGAVVGNSCYLGVNSCLIQGITLGEFVLVGAGSTVIRDVAADTTVVGTPARILRKTRS